MLGREEPESSVQFGHLGSSQATKSLPAGHLQALQLTRQTSFPQYCCEDQLCSSARGPLIISLYSPPERTVASKALRRSTSLLHKPNICGRQQFLHKYLKRNPCAISSKYKNTAISIVVRCGHTGILDIFLRAISVIQSQVYFLPFDSIEDLLYSGNYWS